MGCQNCGKPLEWFLALLFFSFLFFSRGVEGTDVDLNYGGSKQLQCVCACKLGCH